MLEQSADGEGVVANDLRIEPQPALAGQQPVVRIDQSQFRPGVRRLPIRRRGHDQTMHVPQVPAFAQRKLRLHELHGEPVEQLRMRGRRPLQSEVVFRLDQALAEVVLPQSIHGDSGRERIGTIDQPASQIEAIRAAILQRRQPMQHARHLRQHLSALAREIPAKVHARFARLRQFLQHQRGRKFWLPLEQRRELVQLRLEARLLRDEIVGELLLLLAAALGGPGSDIP